MNTTTNIPTLSLNPPIDNTQLVSGYFYFSNAPFLLGLFDQFLEIERMEVIRPSGTQGAYILSMIVRENPSLGELPCKRLFPNQMGALPANDLFEINDILENMKFNEDNPAMIVEIPINFLNPYNSRYACEDFAEWYQTNPEDHDMITSEFLKEIS